MEVVDISTRKLEISRLIVEEIDRVTTDEDLRLLAQYIMKFELDNWKKERPQFVSSYEALLQKAARRRQKKHDDRVNND